MADSERIKQLLGSGLSNEVVANATGVSPSYISQLMSDDNFKNEVVALRADGLQASTLRDRKMDGLEDRLIETLENSLDLIYKPSDVLRALSTVNALKRRGAPAQQAMTPQTTIVNLNIAHHLIAQSIAASSSDIKMTEHKEVVQIGEQTMVTMPSHQLLKQLQQKALVESTAAQDQGVTPHDAVEAAKRAERYRAVSNFLPTAVVIDA